MSSVHGYETRIAQGELEQRHARQILLAEVGIGVAVFVTGLNGRGVLAPIASEAAKLAVLLVSALLVGSVALSQPRQYNLPRHVVLGLVLYVTMMVIYFWATLRAGSDLALLKYPLQLVALVCLSLVLVCWDRYASPKIILVAAVLSSIAAITFPGGSSSGTHLTDGGSHASAVGFLACFGLGASWVIFKHRAFPLIAVSLLFAVALVLSYNRNSLIAVILALFLFVCLKRDQWRVWRVAAVATLLFFFGRTIFTIALQYLFDGDLAGARSGTGRTTIWTRLLSVSGEWSGQGLGLGWNSDTASFSLSRLASLGQPAENSLLDAWITGGAAAALTLCLILIGVLKSVLSADMPIQSKIIFICASATAGLVTSGLMGTSAPSVVLLLLLGLPARNSEVEYQPHAEAAASGPAAASATTERGDNPS